jgi:7,8-dihydropterin-6-yl-methyl-4-(beta-D-ribofuranosyl)aminobenzene 5'-phosphate synthase
MSPRSVPLHEADAVRITIVADNSTDALMAGAEVAHRLPLGTNAFAHPLPIVEHGFSVLFEVRRGERRGTVLFDTGVSRTGLLHNLDAREINPANIGAIVLSHGHTDHAMGLPGLMTRIGRRLPLVLHPEAYVERKLMLPNGDEVNLLPPRRADLPREQIEVIEEVGPSLLVDDTLLVSGEVARTTESDVETEVRGSPLEALLDEESYDALMREAQDKLQLFRVDSKVVMPIGAYIITAATP